MSNPPHPSSSTSTSTSTSTSDKPRPSVPSVPPAHINLISAVKRDFAPSNLHPSTRPFVRSFLFGYISTVAPPILKTIIKLVLNKKFGARKVGGALRDVFKALIKGLDPRGMGMAAGVAIGGARWGEEIVRLWIEELVRRWKVRVGKSKSLERDGRSEEPFDPNEQSMISTASTFVASTISSLLAIMILQSAPSYSAKMKSRRVAIAAASPYTRLVSDGGEDPLTTNNGNGNGFPGLHLSTTPRPSFANSTQPIQPQSPHPSIDNIVNPAHDNSRESPTLDLTLFVLVRGLDILVRGVYTAFPRSHRGWISWVAGQADTLVFQLSCLRIMWCWFYLPNRLPPSYIKWITNLSAMDVRLLRLLRAARAGMWNYGSPAVTPADSYGPGIAQSMNLPEWRGRPENIDKFPCVLVHGKVGHTESCEVNTLRRLVRAWVQCMGIYLPVHIIPRLFFNTRKIVSQPVQQIVGTLLAASRSAAFLSTFIASIWASVCLVRTRLGPRLLPWVPQQTWDSGACALLGCFMCGFSVLIENKRRRGEMALYVAPRALYAVLDELLPQAVVSGQRGEFLGKWIERVIFALSTGVATTASVHRPDLMRGVVKGLMNYLVGDWGGRKVLPPPGPSRQNSEVKSLKGVGDTKNLHDHVEKERVRL